MTLLTHLSEEVGLDYGYTFALISLAWAPGQTIGAAGGGALAHATSDAVPYTRALGRLPRHARRALVAAPGSRERRHS